ncbi:multicopper oxidase [Zasmidium cellare ATCC 36951]|uniref:Multicopper oxidase n=1 Tax=Zasmidium cellare ATCC 36951 TaxID=1080233 RepID=A0A6A6CA31_ZASCE|nr:multicopper oxidase [Zasmidium cellare ATCC 36951]KAF2164057.1 multicopper oxidase [Zasmidium cellare ATCC 36951]
MLLYLPAICSLSLLNIAWAASHVRPRYPYGPGPSRWAKRAVTAPQTQPWHKRQTISGNNNGTNSIGGCPGNTASDRGSWCDFSIDTNWYLEVPNTGRTVEYYFEMVNTTLSPDGVPKIVLTVNGTMPGPVIEANWGDEVVVHFKNNFENNGTGIHFHGIRQNWTNPEDGVPSITQCPTAPGETVTYRWRATQYGSSWYHSHFAVQAWDGVFGPIVIHGPASANYDVDLGSMFLQDWTHDTASSLYSIAETQGPPPMANGLINGTNIFGDGGSRWEASVEAGRPYRLRLVNPSVDTFFAFSIDNHTLQVIATDFVPIVPYETDVIGLGAGQRYDVIFTANQEAIASDFWLRAVPDNVCSAVNQNPDDIKGIIHYGDSTGTPTTSPWTSDNSFLACQDPPLASLVPVVEKDAGVSGVNNITFFSEWEDPTALQILNEDHTYETQQAVIELPNADEWMYLIIQQANTAPHPIHLHGHDFWILASGPGTYSSNVPLQTVNPPRRDVAMLPGAGFIILGFETDNPGAWLVHCHIGWHTSEGFALQFVERIDEIAEQYNETALRDSCAKWFAYDEATNLEQHDSGV